METRGNLIQVRYEKRCKRMTLQRAITSKIVHFPELLTISDILVLFDNLLWCQDKSAKDPDFQNKFGLPLKVQTEILKNLNLSRRLITTEQIKKLQKAFRDNLEGFYLEKRNTKPVLHQQARFFSLKYPQQEGIPLSLLPPKQYIGKGYGDKGTAKKPWLDGSPSWQEVASIPLKEL